MLPKEMNPWPWTWMVWGKDKYGLMGRALGDTGLPMLVVIVTDAVILEHLDLQSVSLVVANPPSNGNNFFRNL